MDDDTHALVADLHAQLEATAELPVETAASRWIGEAEAVVSDVATGDPPESAVRTRVEQARELLSHVDGTGNAAADEHIERARDIVATVEERIDG